MTKCMRQGRRLGLCLMTAVLLTACGLGRRHLIPIDMFEALYPRGYATVVAAQIEAEAARELVSRAEVAERGAQALRKALAARFEVVEEAMEYQQRWGEAALAERWDSHIITDLSACTDLQGGLQYIEALADQAARALIAWRGATLDEAQALLAIREIEIEQHRIAPFFEQVPSSPGRDPEAIRAYWDEKRTGAVAAWNQARGASDVAREAFDALRQEFEEYRVALPADTTCPVFLRHDPLLEGFDWDARGVALPASLVEEGL